MDSPGWSAEVWEGLGGICGGAGKQYVYEFFDWIVSL